MRNRTDHGPKERALLRFISKLEREGDCLVRNIPSASTSAPSLTWRNGTKVHSESSVRAMYRQYVGDIPPGCRIEHTCDNARCVRPEHLALEQPYFGTPDAFAEALASLTT